MSLSDSISPALRRNIYRILPFGLIWAASSIVYSFLEKGLLGQLTTYPSTGLPYDFKNNLVYATLFAAFMGVFIGGIEVLYLNRVFIQKSFGKKLFYKTLIYVSSMISFLLIVGLINNALELNTSFFDPQVWSNVGVFFSSFAFWSVQIYLAAVIGLTLFYVEVSDSLGLDVLYNFFTGKYNKPIEEERIFMFLDMKSSTTIAEKLGHIKYFDMLWHYYSDLSYPILDYAGEIYQYVGDEVIVTWTLKKGLKNNNCLRCFFAMKEAMNKASEKYLSEFGLVPTFKAGIHYGKVTTGEIGVIKKDITFSGDVLNTAARIQGLCNTYEVDLLLSNKLMKKIDLAPEFKARILGETELRGRNQKVELVTIDYEA